MRREHRYVLNPRRVNVAPPPFNSPKSFLFVFFPFYRTPRCKTLILSIFHSFSSLFHPQIQTSSRCTSSCPCASLLFTQSMFAKLKSCLISRFHGGTSTWIGVKFEVGSYFLGDSLFILVGYAFIVFNLFMRVRFMFDCCGWNPKWQVWLVVGTIWGLFCVLHQASYLLYDFHVKLCKSSSWGVDWDSNG